MRIKVDFYDIQEEKYKRIKNITLWALITVILATAIVCINSCIPQPASAEEVDMDIIAVIESNGNPNAVSYRGAKYGRGLCQVSEIVLKEYNQKEVKAVKGFLKGEIIPDELFIDWINLEIANWYMNTRIPQMLRHYKIKPCADDERHDLYCWKEVDLKLIAYNWGISHLKQWYYTGANYNKLPKETKNYLIKYYQLLSIK